MAVYADSMAVLCRFVLYGSGTSGLLVLKLILNLLVLSLLALSL